METLTLVLTDVQGSTRLWAEEPDSMDAAMRRHHEIVHGAIDEHGGFRPPDQGEGDAVFAAFASPVAAVAAVAQVQRGLSAVSWPTSRPLRVRAGVHVGEVRVRDGNLFGDPVNRCARIRGLGSGGQTLLSAAVFELVRDQLPAGGSVQDLGEHRMKDLVRPERVHQLDVAGLETEFPPLASLDRATHNLPVQPTPFVGRERDLADLVATVREHRLVTVTAFGGMGKTRLALQAAAELVGEPEVGDVWFVDLASVTDPRLVPARMAEAAGLRYDDDPLAALASAYADGRALFVLDNLEQVLDCATLVADLVARTPGVRVLATSRAALRVRAERVVPLPPLSLPDPDGPPETSATLGAYEAVRLFLDRAASVRPDFAVTDANAPAIAAICARLDGSPLAIELAASRMRMLSVDSLLQRLDAALTILTGGSRDMPQRHQTLRATIAWSYDALAAEQQILLARMSVLPAPADLAMVEAVCGEGLDVFVTLEDLVDRNLVRAVEADADFTYTLLVAIRDFAGEHLDAGERVRLRDAHADHLRSLLPELTGLNLELPLLVARMLPHVRAALDHRRTVPDHRFVDLVTNLGDGLIHQGLSNESRPDLELALTLTSDPRQRTFLHLFASTAMSSRMHEHARLGMVAAIESGDEFLIATGASAHVLAAASLAEIEAGLDAYASVRERLPDHLGLELDTELCNNVGGILRFADPARTTRMLVDQLEKVPLEGPLQVRLGRILLDHGRLSDAASVLRLPGPDADFHGILPWERIGTAEIARLALLRGDEAKARALATPAFEWVVGSDEPAAFYPAQVMADLERAADDPAAAAHVVDRALPLCVELGGYPAGSLRWRRGRALLQLGRRDVAREELAAARSMLEGDALLGTLELLGCLAAEALLVHQEDPDSAAALLATVAERRGDWVLPHFADRDVETVATALGLPRRT